MKMNLDLVAAFLLFLEKLELYLLIKDKREMYEDMGAAKKIPSRRKPESLLEKLKILKKKKKKKL